MGRMPWPSSQHPSPAPCSQQQLKCTHSVPWGKSSCKHLGKGPRGARRDFTGGDTVLCSCTARIHSLPGELLKVLHWETNNFKRSNASGFVLADSRAEQELSAGFLPSLSLLGSSFEHLQHHSTGPDLLDKPDFIIFLKGGYYLLPPKERGRGESH